jgi:hypothetical protein
MGFVLRGLRGFCNVAGGYGPLDFTAPLGGWVVLGILAYARLAGMALLVAAAAGLAIFGWEEAAIYYHAGLGLFFLFVGFSGWETTTVRQVVGGLGVLLVVVKGLAILATWLLPIRYLHGPVEIACLIVGVASILAARYLPDRRSPRHRRVD